MRLRTEGVTTAGDVRAGWLGWRAGGRLHVTLVVKASFALRAGATMARLPAESLCEDEPPLDPGARWPSDAVPYLAHCDVLFVGHGHPPRPGATRGHVRLALRGDGVHLDKA